MDRRLANHERRLEAVEQKVDFVVQSALPAPEMMFMEGEFLTAHEAIRKIVKAAKKRSRHSLPQKWLLQKQI